MRLLLLDDDDDTRALLERFFVRQGADVCSVATVSEACRELSDAHYDALLTDLELPDGSGRQLLSAGRPKSLRAAVLMTGQAGEDEPAKSLRAGFDSHVTKPIDRSAVWLLLCLGAV